MRTRLASWIALIVIAQLAPLRSRAQASTEVIVPDRITCARCTIQRTTLARLGSAQLEGEISEMPLVVRYSPRGEYWVLSDLMPPRVYSASGTYLRTIGRKGRGPGEYQAPADVLWLPGDSTLVIDGLSRRGTILAPDGRVARAVQLSTVLHNSIVIHWPTRVLSFAQIRSASGAVDPLHISSLAGDRAAITASFSATGAVERATASSRSWTYLARAPNGRFYSAPVSQPRVHEWTEPGRQGRTFVRSAVGFSETASSPIGTPDRPPPNSIAAIDVDDAGNLWLFIRVAAPTWRNGWADVPKTAREAPIRQFDMASLVNTRVEVIDLARGEVLARAELPGYLITVLRGGRVAVMGHSALGEGEVRIDQLTLRGAAAPAKR